MQAAGWRRRRSGHFPARRFTPLISVVAVLERHLKLWWVTTPYPRLRCLVIPRPPFREHRRESARTSHPVWARVSRSRACFTRGHPANRCLLLLSKISSSHQFLPRETVRHFCVSFLGAGTSQTGSGNCGKCANPLRCPFHRCFSNAAPAVFDWRKPAETPCPRNPGPPATGAQKFRAQYFPRPAAGPVTPRTRAGPRPAAPACRRTGPGHRPPWCR
jgi:hypothetical protein